MERRSVYRTPVVRVFCLTLAAFFLAACNNNQSPNILTERDYDVRAATAVAQEVLADLQVFSFAENVEYCGFIGIDPGGTIRALPPRRGGRNRCELWYFPADWTIIATYHTHGGFDPQKKSEAPSVLDLKGVLPLGLVGFLSTPGGRFWKFGGEEETAELICGLKCLPQDLLFEPIEPIKDSYTIEELSERERK